MQEKYKNSYKATEKELVSLSVTPFWYIQTRRLSTAPMRRNHGNTPGSASREVMPQ